MIWYFLGFAAVLLASAPAFIWLARKQAQEKLARWKAADERTQKLCVELKEKAKNFKTAGSDVEPTGGEAFNAPTP